MSHMGRVGLALVAALVATITIAEESAQAQENQGEESSYRLVDGWAQLPNGVDAWGQTIGFVQNAMPEGVTVDRMGNVYAGEVLGRNLKKFVRD